MSCVTLALILRIEAYRGVLSVDAVHDWRGSPCSLFMPLPPRQLHPQPPSSDSFFVYSCSTTYGIRHQYPALPPDAC